jgi:hypothetical protein
MPCPAKELGTKAVDVASLFVAPVFRPAGFKVFGRRISNNAIVKKGEERWI